jgi:hypothetical protein
MSKEEHKITRGLTLRVLLGFLFLVFIVQPIVMYYYLISNSFFLLSAWIPILFFSEIANLLRAKLSKSELFMFMIFYPVSFAYSLFFINLIKNTYFAYSEASELLGIEKYIPSWWVPSKSSWQKIFASNFVFLHNSWVFPILISLTFLFLSVINDLILGYLTYEVFVVEEKMEFPFARAQVALIESLSERNPEFIRVLFLSALFGAIFHFTTKFVPFLIGALMIGGTYVYSLPSFFYDFTPYLDYLLPGAGFIVPTDLSYYVVGLLLPENVAFIQFLASISLYIFGTHFITRFNLWPVESKWATGWGYWTLQYRSLVYFYVSLIIGLSLSAMILPLIFNPTPLIRGIKALVSASKSRGHLLSANVLLGLYFGSSLSMILLAWYLTSFSFPIIVLLLLIIGGSFLATYVSTASAGVTVFGTSIPYLRELAIYYSGSQTKDIWFVPLPVSLSSSIVGTATTGAVSSPLGGSAVTQALLQADLLGVSHSEFIKSYIVLILLSLISSFVLTTAFWILSPIPSAAYPYTVTAWPVDAVSWARIQVWVWSGYLFRTPWIGLGLLSGAAIFILSGALRMPYLLFVFITGSLMGIPSSFSQLVGSLFGNKVLKLRLKEERWRNYSRLIVVGYLLGDAVMEALRILIVLVIKSQWLLPY